MIGVLTGALGPGGTASGALFTAVQMPSLKTAYGKVLDGTDDAYYYTIGDSTEYGRGAGTGGLASDGARAKSTTAKMAERLLALGYVVSCDAFFSTGQSSDIAGFNAYYTAASPLTGSVVVDSATWTIGAATLGGALFTKSSLTAGPITITPALTNDTLDVYYADTNNGSVTVKRNGVTVGTAATSGTSTNNPLKSTFVNAGPGSWTIETNDASPFYFLGAIARSSSTKRLIIVNVGARGWTSGNLIDSSSPIRPLNMIDFVKPAAASISPGINDIRDGGGTTANMTALQSNIVTLANKVALYGDCIFKTPNRIAPADDIGPNAFMADVDSYYKSTVGSRLLIDSTLIAGGYNVANWADGLHPLAPYYTQLGTVEANAIDASLVITPYTKVSLSGSPGPGSVGDAFDFTPTTAFGRGTKTCAFTGTLPPGTSFVSGTGRVFGTLTTNGTYSYSVTATDTTGTSTPLVVNVIVSSFLKDSFTGTAGPFGSHQSDAVGGGPYAYTVNPGASFSFDASNRGYADTLGASSTASLLSAWVPSSPNYFVQENTTTLGAFVSAVYVGGRMVDGLNGYCAGFRRSTSLWVIGKFVAGTLTNLVSVAGTVPQNTPQKVRLEMVGTQLTLFVNDVQTLQTNDSTYTAAGSAGLVTIATAVPTATGGVHFDDLLAGLL